MHIETHEAEPHEVVDRGVRITEASELITLFVDKERRILESGLPTYNLV
jgi:hypothetical protein